MNNKKIVLLSYMIVCLVWGILTGNVLPQDSTLVNASNTIVFLIYMNMVMIGMLFIAWVYKYSEATK